MSQMVESRRDMGAELAEMNTAIAIARAIARPLIVASIYILGLSFVGVPLLKSSAIALIALILIAIPMGSRAVQYTSLILLSYVLVSWLGILPDLATLFQTARCQLTQL